jgi:hypothetical protein
MRLKHRDSPYSERKKLMMSCRSLMLNRVKRSMTAFASQHPHEVGKRLNI